MHMVKITSRGMHHVVALNKVTTVTLYHHAFGNKRVPRNKKGYHGQRVAFLDWLGLQGLQILLLILLQQIRQTRYLIVAINNVKIRQ